MVWKYGKRLWRIAGGRSVQARLRIGTVSLGKHCGHLSTELNEKTKAVSELN